MTWIGRLTARALLVLSLGFSLAACDCSSNESKSPGGAAEPGAVKPVIVTQPVAHDSDDPAVWVDRQDPSRSLILGTDKDADGNLYVFDLKGRIINDKVVRHLKRPNNVDVEYGLKLAGEPVDIAVLTERQAESIRVFSLPDLRPLDGGGLPVFQGDQPPEYRAPMGIALYKRPSDGAVFAVVSRKSGPTEGYLGQYLLEDDGQGKVKATLVRKFGKYGGNGEIEAIAADDSAGYIYYSDEAVGVRKYHADPEKGDQELALFATDGFAQDREGISIYPTGPLSGYILVSDQQADEFHIYPREGTPDDPNRHPLLKKVKVSTHESDGSEVCPVPLGPDFPGGLFVAMSDDKTFQFYRLEDLIK